MIISVASGKGGTGKTTIATNLALSLSNVQFLDCDVEEPNAHLFLKPVFSVKKSVYIPVPEIDEQKCTLCWACKEACRYKAIAIIADKVLPFSDLCHGCGACSYVCPSGAIREVQKEIGVVEVGTSGDILFVHGMLNIGQSMAPPVIRSVKEKIDDSKTIIIDAPPGTSCPVIASMKDSDFCVLVTEATPFGLYDLKLAVAVVRELGIPFGVIINRSDLGTDDTVRYCQKEHVPVLMSLPFDRAIAEAYSRGIPLVSAHETYKSTFRFLYEDIEILVKKHNAERCTR